MNTRKKRAQNTTHPIYRRRTTHQNIHHHSALPPPPTKWRQQPVIRYPKGRITLEIIQEKFPSFLRASVKELSLNTPFLIRALRHPNRTVREYALQLFVVMLRDHTIRLPRNAIKAIQQFTLNERNHSMLRAQAMRILIANGKTSKVLARKIWHRFKSYKDELTLMGLPIALYGEHVFDTNFTGTTGIRRAEQPKTGSRTILHGGKLYGKVTTRIIPEFAFEAWKKAFEAGVPVEPILMKNGHYRVQASHRGGVVRVQTGVLKGVSVSAFLKNPAYRDWKYTIREQEKKIVDQLKELRINHTHIHDYNLIVIWRKFGPTRYPQVILIDFDKAWTS